MQNIYYENIYYDKYIMNFNNRRILIGICGSIAAYKTVLLVQELKKLGAEVRVVMTDNAQKFISLLTFQALTQQPAFDDAMSHITWARWADTFIIAPASAHTIAKIAHGLADDMLSTLALSLVPTVPLIICPAMNQAMWSNPATQHNINLLKERQVEFIGPDAGLQACGETGFGRLCEVEEIIESLRLIPIMANFKNKKILITAGGTQEAIDPVRVISNHSSGKMGYALARAAQRANAQVTLISGKTHLEPPLGVNLISVTSAAEMFEAVKQHLPTDIFIASAAVADYYVENIPSNKIKKTASAPLTLTLKPTVDILSYVGTNKLAQYITGFAAETDQLLENARQKLLKKECHMIIANIVSNQQGYQQGFNQDNNQITLITKAQIIELPLMHKTFIAKEIIQYIAADFSQITGPK